MFVARARVLPELSALLAASAFAAYKIYPAYSGLQDLSSGKKELAEKFCKIKGGCMRGHNKNK
jgi:hypothetical protein